MFTLRDFDIRSRGSASLMREWQDQHSDVRSLWNIEDLIGVVTDALSTAFEMYEQYRGQGRFPGGDSIPSGESPISYFITVAENVRRTAQLAEELGARFEVDGFQVDGLLNLRNALARLGVILSEAEWQEIDLIAPSDDDLARYADEVRPPVDYYAES
jgi:hypothetical protein